MSVFHQAIRLYKLIARRQLNHFLKKEIASLAANSRVLIVGAGGDCEEVIRQAAKNKSFQLDSIDIDPTRKPTIIADIQTYSLEGSFYDAIFIPEVLEHLPSPQLALSNVYNALKSSGRVVASVPFIFPEHDLPHDYFRFTSSALRELFGNFQNLQIIKRDSWPEAIFKLVARLMFSSQKQTAYLGIIFLFIYFLFLPGLLLVGLLFPDENITSGYLVVATKQ